MPVISTVDNGRTLTATGLSGPFNCIPLYMEISCNVTAISGTSPSLQVSILWSADNVTFGPASPPDQMSAQTTTGEQTMQVNVKAPYFKIQYTVTGTTPSVTFTTTIWN